MRRSILLGVTAAMLVSQPMPGAAQYAEYYQALEARCPKYPMPSDQVQHHLFLVRVSYDELKAAGFSDTFAFEKLAQLPKYENAFRNACGFSLREIQKKGLASITPAGSLEAGRKRQQQMIDKCKTGAYSSHNRCTGYSELIDLR